VRGAIELSAESGSANVPDPISIRQETVNSQHYSSLSVWPIQYEPFGAGPRRENPWLNNRGKPIVYGHGHDRRRDESNCSTAFCQDSVTVPYVYDNEISADSFIVGGGSAAVSKPPHSQQWSISSYKILASELNLPSSGAREYQGTEREHYGSGRSPTFRRPAEDLIEPSRNDPASFLTAVFFGIAAIAYNLWLDAGSKRERQVIDRPKRSKRH
jgi:hypothetical protein